MDPGGTMTTSCNMIPMKGTSATTLCSNQTTKTRLQQQRTYTRTSNEIKSSLDDESYPSTTTNSPSSPFPSSSSSSFPSSSLVFVDYTPPPPSSSTSVSSHIQPPAKYKLWLLVAICAYVADWLTTKANVKSYLKSKWGFSTNGAVWVVYGTLIAVLIYAALDLMKFIRLPIIIPTTTTTRTIRTSSTTESSSSSSSSTRKITSSSSSSSTITITGCCWKVITSWWKNDEQPKINNDEDYKKNNKEENYDIEMNERMNNETKGITLNQPSSNHHHHHHHHHDTTCIDDQFQQQQQQQQSPFTLHKTKWTWQFVGIEQWLKQPRIQWVHEYDHWMIQLLAGIIHILEDGFAMFDVPTAESQQQQQQHPFQQEMPTLFDDDDDDDDDEYDDRNHDDNKNFNSSGGYSKTASYKTEEETGMVTRDVSALSSLTQQDHHQQQQLQHNNNNEQQATTFQKKYHNNHDRHVVLRIENRIKPGKDVQYLKWEDRIIHNVLCNKAMTPGLLHVTTERQAEQQQQQQQQHNHDDNNDEASNDHGDDDCVGRANNANVHAIYLTFATIDHLNQYMTSPIRARFRRKLQPLLAIPSLVQLERDRCLPDACTDLCTPQGLGGVPKHNPAKWKVWWLTSLGFYITVLITSGTVLDHYWDTYEIQTALPLRVHSGIRIIINTWMNSYIFTPLLTMMFHHWLHHQPSTTATTTTATTTNKTKTTTQGNRNDNDNNNNHHMDNNHNIKHVPKKNQNHHHHEKKERRITIKEPYRTLNEGIESIWLKMVIVIIFYGGCSLAWILSE